MNERNPGLAAVLSFFIIGLGQIYSGAVLRGILFMVCSTILLLTVVGIIILPFVWLYNIYDAHQCAIEENLKEELYAKH